MPPMLPPGRWALTPPFHPYRRPNHSRCPEGFPSSYHRVSFRRRYILCGTFRDVAAEAAFAATPTTSPGVTRRVAHTAFAVSVSGLSSRPACAEPAIIRLTRRSNYTASSVECGGLQPLSHRRPHDRIQGQLAPALRGFFLSCTLSLQIPTSFSNSFSVKIVTPNSFALSCFDPGSVPTTT
jgi:hypothetical protein